MNETRITLHTGFRIGAVDPRIFGGFLEHIGRAVYQGVFDPKSRLADADGFRTDVLSALRRLDMTAMRYPGGNFASGYHWMDGIGPKDKRPTVRDLAWQTLEPNSFGTDEFLALCRKMSWTPMVTVNLGTGTPEEARNWVEYCNCPAGTRYADMRAAGGSRDPFGVKLWCLGNEMDGKWQLGHVPAGEYAIRAQQAAKMMKDADKTIETVVCGTCAVELPTYMEWDRLVLEYMGPYADYVSLHRYVGNRNDDTADYLAVTAAIDRQIEEMDAACRFVQARHRTSKRVYLCFDEWNVWYKNHQADGRGEFAPHLIEEIYNLEDALVVGGFLNSFIRHADVLKIANLAQIVNVIAPLLTSEDKMLVQPTFYPFEMMTKRREGVSLRLALSGPSYEGKTHGKVPVIDASAILNSSRLSVFLVNRSQDQPAPVTIALADRAIAGLESAECLAGPGAKSVNTFDDQAVRPVRFDEVKVKDGGARLTLPPLSMVAMTLSLD